MQKKDGRSDAFFGENGRDGKKEIRIALAKTRGGIARGNGFVRTRGAFMLY